VRGHLGPVVDDRLPPVARRRRGPHRRDRHHRGLVHRVLRAHPRRAARRPHAELGGREGLAARTAHDPRVGRRELRRRDRPVLPGRRRRARLRVHARPDDPGRPRRRVPLHPPAHAAARPHEVLRERAPGLGSRPAAAGRADGAVRRSWARRRRDGGTRHGGRHHAGRPGAGRSRARALGARARDGRRRRRPRGRAPHDDRGAPRGRAASRRAGRRRRRVPDRGRGRRRERGEALMASGFAQWGNDLYTGRRSYAIVAKRRAYFVVAAVLVVLSLGIIGVRIAGDGLNLGIEFRGGSEFTVSGVSDTSQQPALDAVAAVAPEEVPRVTSVGGSTVRVQTAQLSNAQVEQVATELAGAYGAHAGQVTSSYIGPTWGKDVSQKALVGLVVFLLLVSLVMTVYFRNWRMALAAVIALFHDLVVTVGIYALIGWEITPATVIGLLTILAYSIYDTVVVFDKVRENTAGVLDQTRSTYAERANLAVNQTLVRSINTSVVALLPVAGILFIGAFLLGAGTLRDIALALFVGMAVGAYSSVFLATPLEVELREREKPIRDHTAKVLALRAERTET